MKTPLLLELEFARAEPADPSAFRLASQQYLLRREGGRFETARFDWTSEVETDLYALRMPGRDPEIAPRLGALLQKFLQTTDWAALEVQILDALRDQRTVVLTIRSSAAELYVLPWELLSLRNSGQHLGELPNVLVRYKWPALDAEPAEEISRRENGRILFAWSAAAGGVPKAEHLAALQSASQRGRLPFDSARDVLEHVSCERLVAELEAARTTQQPIAVLHLLCHGAAIGDSYGLALNGEVAGEPAPVDAGRLRQLLAPYAGMLRLVVISACDSGNSGAVGSHLGSLAQTLHCAGIAQVIASRYPLTVNGSQRFTEAFYAELLGRPSSIEQAFLTARAKLALDPTQLDWASLQLYAHAVDSADSRPIHLRPYRGLLAFAPEHQRFFFGRDREIAEIVADARSLIDKHAPRLLAVDGASGSGKSSVVFAGALPKLLSLLGENAAYIRMRPGSDPMQALDEALKACPPSRPALLIVDQFEELFTQTPDPAQRRAFSRQLWDLATRPDSEVFVLITLRSDFVGHCGELTLDDAGLRLDRVIYDEGHRVSIAQMNVEQLRAIIEQPAACVGLALEPGLTERLLHDVDSEPGALPLVADTLDLLWQRRVGKLLTQAAYDQIGGVTGALHGRADQLIAALSEAERREARRLLVRLGSGLSDLTTGVRLRVRVSTRRPSSAAEAAHFDSMLTRLTAARLLVLDREGAEDTVEVAHEALLRKWPLLAQWAQQDSLLIAELDLIETWVRQWRAHGTRLTGQQLERAAEVVARHADALSAEARAMYADSCEEQARIDERDRFARDCLRMLAVRGLDGDVTRQAAILREAECRDPAAVPMWLPYTVDILQTGVLMQAQLLGHQAAIVHGAWSADGLSIATASTDGSARLFKPLGGAAEVLCEGVGAVHCAHFSPDGRRLVVACADGTARVFFIGGGREPLILRGHTQAVTCAVFSPDGLRIATASADGTARLWGMTGQALILRGHKGAVRTVAFSSDGSSVITAGVDGVARVYSLDDPEDPDELDDHDAPLKMAAFSSSSEHGLTVAEDGTALLWDEDGDSKELEVKGEEISAASFSPDGKRVALGFASGGVLLQDVVGKAKGVSLLKGAGEVTGLCFSPDGSWLAATFDDGDPCVCSLENRGLVYWLEGHLGLVTCIVWSPDGRQVVSLSEDGTGRLFDMKRPEMYTPCILSEQDAGAFMFAVETAASSSGAPAAASLDGRRTATAASDGSVRIITKGPSKPLILPAVGGAVTALCFAPDGDALVTVAADGMTRLWRMSGGAPVSLPGHRGAIRGLDVSADGKRVVVGGEDGRARVYSLDGSAAPLLLEGHTKAVTLAAFSPDGTRILTMSNDGTTRLWGERGRSDLLIEADIEAGDDRGVGVSRDWKHFVTENKDKLRLVWQLEFDAVTLRQRLWQATPYCLSALDRERHLRETADQAAAGYALSVSKVSRAS